jgi:hypothetical protein
MFNLSGNLIRDHPMRMTPGQHLCIGALMGNNLDFGVGPWILGSDHGN